MILNTKSILLLPNENNKFIPYFAKNSQKQVFLLHTAGPFSPYASN